MNSQLSLFTRKEKVLLEATKIADGKLIPSSEKSIKIFNRVKIGEEILIDYKAKRNVQFHKKGFALLNLVFQNQDIYRNLEDLRVEFRLKSGYYTEHITTKGKLIYIPKSMSFAEMDENEFEELYSKFIDIALKHFVKMDKRDFEDAILRFA